LVLNGQHEKALKQANSTIEHCRKSGDAFALPELLRIKADVLRILTPDDINAVETLLDESITMARQQGARAWELRASMDLARGWLDQGRDTEAKALLKACRDQATEGFDTLDLRQLETLWERVVDR
jgi:predicted ATPase